MDCSPPGSSIHGILSAGILEWVAISFPRGSSRHRDRTRVSRIAGGLFTIWASRSSPFTKGNGKKKSRGNPKYKSKCELKNPTCWAGWTHPYSCSLWEGTATSRGVSFKSRQKAFFVTIHRKYSEILPQWAEGLDILGKDCPQTDNMFSEEEMDSAFIIYTIYIFIYNSVNKGDDAVLDPAQSLCIL